MNDIKEPLLKNDGVLKVTPELRGVLNALPFYVFLIDENHNICFANNAVSTHLGLDPDAIINLYCPKVVHDQDSPVPKCPLEESEATGQAVEREAYDEKNGLWVTSVVYPTELKTEKGMKVFFHMIYDISKRKTAELRLKKSLERLENITEAGIRAFSIFVEKRDPYTAGHQTKVGRMAFMITKEMGLDEETARGVRIAGLLHDIGKIVVPIEILSKPGKISDDEFRIIKKHPIVGFDILKDIEFDWPVAAAVLQHHERLDGSGYPNGLRGDEIMLEARIISVADVLEAMTSFRPYRPALNLISALEELSDKRDVLYDARAVDSCLKLCNEGKFDFCNIEE